MAVDGTGLALVAAGTLFAYAGITGKSVLSSLYAIVSGNNPSGVAQANPITGTPATAVTALGSPGSPASLTGTGTASIPANPSEVQWIQSFLSAIGAPATA